MGIFDAINQFQLIMKLPIYLILFLICTNHPAIAQKNLLKGTILFENDSAAKNVEIRVYDNDENPVTILHTDKQGYFEFRTSKKILVLDIRSNDLNFKSSVEEYVFNKKSKTDASCILTKRDPEEVEQIKQGIQKLPTAEKPKLRDQFCPDLVSGTEDTATFKEVYACLVGNIEYPMAAQEAGAQGRILIQFVVDEYGKISNVEIINGSYAILEEESLRAAACLSGLSPASCGGKKVSTYYTLPLRFTFD